MLDRIDDVLTPYLSTRASNVLKRAGIKTFEQLRALNPRDLPKVYGCGLKTYREIMGFRKMLFPKTRPRYL